MKNQILDGIVKEAARRLTLAYGFCGIAMGDDVAMLNSSDREGGEILINITIKLE